MDKIEAGNLTRRGAGRPKGAKNKMGVAAKEAIEHAAAGLGGADRLMKWAKANDDNERAFWVTIYPKLLPLQVNASGTFTVMLPGHVTKL